MTGKEAIKVLLDEWKCIDRNDGINCDRKCEKCDLVMDSAILKEAYNMAIKALEQEPCDDVVSREAVKELIKSGISTDTYEDIELVCKWVDEMPPARPQLCDDAISRQAVLKAIDDDWICNAEHDYRGLAEEIEKLPSVQPKPKTGHWIWCVGSHKCSNCEEYTCFSHKELLDYCPNCGARMFEPQESEKGSEQ